MASGAQNIVGLGGLGLIVVNYWTGSQRTAVSSVLFSGASSSGARPSIVELGSELLFVGVATALAGISSQWATAMVVVVIAVWVLWLTVGEGRTWANGKISGSSTSGSSGSGGANPNQSIFGVNPNSTGGLSPPVNPSKR